MRGDEEEAPLVDIVQHVGHALVVARVRLLNCVPDWGGYTVGRSERPLLAHVRAPNQLDAEVVAEGLGAGDLILDDLRHSLEVTLVPVEDRVLAVSVELVGQLLGEGFDGHLHIGLLSIDVKNAISLVSVAHDFSNSLGELRKYLQIVLRDIGVLESQSDLLENCIHFFII